MGLLKKKTDNGGDKKVSWEKATRRISNIISWYHKKHHQSLRVYFGCLIADIEPIIAQMSIHSMERLFVNIENHIIIGHEESFKRCGPCSAEHNVNTNQVVIPMGAPPAFTKPDDMFAGPYACPSDDALRIKGSSLLAIREQLDQVIFSDEIKAKMFDVVNSLQSSHGEMFPSHRVIIAINLIKAIALIGGSTTVKVDDLFAMAHIAMNGIDVIDYQSAVDSVIVNYTSIAQNYMNSIAILRTRFTNAKDALSMRQPINYMNSNIQANWSLDDLIVDSIGQIDIIRGELRQLLDGKNQTLNSVKPLVAALEDATKTERLFTQSKGIKV